MSSTEFHNVDLRMPCSGKKMMTCFVRTRRFKKNVFNEFELLYESPGVNPAEGLPPALNTEAVWASQGSFGPAPIGILDQKRIEDN